MTRPNLSYLKNVILAAFGIPCGVLTGATGLSPAPILQPAIRYLLGATGTALNGIVLVMVSFSAWCALLAFGQSGHVQWFNGFFVTIGSFLGASLAARAVGRSPRVFVKIRPLWTFIPLAFALTMIAESSGVSGAHLPLNSALPDEGPLLPLFWSFIIGVIVGFVGLVGELGSVLTIPLMVFLLGRSIWAAEGTALYVLVLASLPTALIHTVRRSVDINAALSLSVGGVLGALFGSHLAVTQLSDSFLAGLCGVVLSVYSLMSLFLRPPADTPHDKDQITRNS